MANQRMVNSKFWSDSYIRKLNYSERYLFLYFLTNEHTNIAGIYEITMDAVLFETGLEKIFVLKTLKKLVLYHILGKIILKYHVKSIRKRNQRKYLQNFLHSNFLAFLFRLIHRFI